MYEFKGKIRLEDANEPSQSAGPTITSGGLPLDDIPLNLLWKLSNATPEIMTLFPEIDSYFAITEDRTLASSPDQECQNLIVAENEKLKINKKIKNKLAFFMVTSEKY